MTVYRGVHNPAKCMMYFQQTNALNICLYLFLYDFCKETFFLSEVNICLIVFVTAASFVQHAGSVHELWPCN